MSVRQGSWPLVSETSSRSHVDSARDLDHALSRLRSITLDLIPVDGDTIVLRLGHFTRPPLGLLLLIALCANRCAAREYSIRDLAAGAEEAAQLIAGMQVRWTISGFGGEFRHGIQVAEMSADNTTKLFGPSLQLQASMLGHEHLKLEGPSSTADEHVKCTNPDYLFALKRRKPLNSWIIEFCEQHGANDQIDRIASLDARSLRAKFLGTHYVNELPLNEFLRKPGVEVKITPAGLDSRGRVRVEFKDPNAPQSEWAFTAGDFYCDPNNKWAIDEMHGVKGDVTCHRLLELGEPVNGFPTVKSYRALFERQSWSWGQVFEMEISPTKPEKKAFYLSAYGFPEPVFQSRSFFGPWTWYLLGALLCGVAGYGIRRRVTKS